MSASCYFTRSQNRDSWINYYICKIHTSHFVKSTSKCEITLFMAREAPAECIIKLIRCLNHLGERLEIVKPLAEQLLLLQWPSVTLPIEKAGFWGWGRVPVSPFNIGATDDMVGLSNASSWTHNNPIWMYLENSSSEKLVSVNNGSTSSNTFPSFQRCHAWIVLED